MKKVVGKYIEFIKYLFVAGLSFLLDIVLFTIFMLIFSGQNEIIISSFLARAISSFINFLLNKNKVFDKTDAKNLVVKYYFLVLVNISASALFVNRIYPLIKISPTLIKVVIDTLLFICNYFVQKKFIFRNKNEKELPKSHKILYAVLTYISFSLILTTSGFSLGLHSGTFRIIRDIGFDIIYLSFFLFYFIKLYKVTESHKYTKILAIVFTIFFLVGNSYHYTSSLKLFYHNEILFLITLLRSLFIYLFLSNFLTLIYNYVSVHKFKKIKDTKLVTKFKERPFLYSFLALLIVCIIYLIPFYPGIINNDNAEQIRETMGFESRYIQAIFKIDESVTYTNFNPLVHTFILGGIFKVGYNLVDANFGILLYTIFQMLIMVAVYAYSIKYLIKVSGNYKYALILLGIYLIVPIFPMYAITGVKDSIYSAFMILYLIKMYDIIKFKQTFKDYLFTFFIILVIVFFRNNGLYTILVSFPLLLFLKKERKQIIIVTMATLTLFLGFNYIVLPIMKIPNTSVREIMSLPFQQTARYVKYYGDEVTEEEKKIIDHVLGYDDLAERYVPRLSDAVKDQYNKYTTTEELMEYMGVWYQMFLKHPMVYIDATMNTTHAYIYPDAYRWYIYTGENKLLLENDINYHFIDSLEPGREVVTVYGEIFQQVPFINLIVNCGFYTWAYFALAIFYIIKKRYKLLLLTLPALSLILMCFVGPANTYFRYVMPYAFPFFLLLFITFLEFNKSFKQE